jgi:hypothetical protein
VVQQQPQQQQSQPRHVSSDGGGTTSTPSHPGTVPVVKEVPSVAGALVRTVSAPSPSQQQPAGVASAAVNAPSPATLPRTPASPTVASGAPMTVAAGGQGGGASLPGTPSSASKRARSAGGATPPPLPPLPLHTLTSSPSILDRPPPVATRIVADSAAETVSPSRRPSTNGIVASTPVKTAAVATPVSPGATGQGKVSSSGGNNATASDSSAAAAAACGSGSSRDVSLHAAAAAVPSKRRNSCTSALAANAAAAAVAATTSGQAQCRSPSPPPAQLGDGASLLAHARSNSLNGAAGVASLNCTSGPAESERWSSPSSMFGSTSASTLVPPRSPVAGPVASGSWAPRPAGLLSRSPSVTLSNASGHTSRAGASSSGVASDITSGRVTSSISGGGGLLPPDDDEPEIPTSASRISSRTSRTAAAMGPTHQPSPPALQLPGSGYVQGSSSGLVAHEVGASLRSWPSIEVDSSNERTSVGGVTVPRAASNSTSSSSADSESVTASHTSSGPGGGGVRGPGACPGVRASSANVSAALASYRSHMVRLSTSMTSSPFRPLTGTSVSGGGAAAEHNSAHGSDGGSGTGPLPGHISSGYGGAPTATQAPAAPASHRPPSPAPGNGPPPPPKTHKRQGSTGVTGGVTSTLQMMAVGGLGDGSVVVNCSPMRHA